MFPLFILYVENQEKSKTFYQSLLQKDPCLHVPGMTEFWINDQSKLGLMPNDGIAKIVHPKMPNPSDGTGIPRCEVYLLVDNAAEFYNRAIDLGAKQITTMQKMDWGHTVGYVADVDGHVLAFAFETKK